MIGRAGASPPSRVYGIFPHIYIYIYIVRPTFANAHARATGKRVAGSLQVQRSLIFSELSRRFSLERLFSFHEQQSLGLGSVNAC